MLQRIEPRESQLAIASRAMALPDAMEPNAGSVMRLPQGDVAADFRATGVDAKGRHATYELRVSNETPGPLATFAYAVGSPQSRQVTWNAIVVPAYSAIAVEIDVAIPRRRRMPRVVAELYTDEAQLTLDALPVERPRMRGGRTAVIASAALLFALGASAFAANRPRVIALAAPDAVRPNTPFAVAYAFADASAGGYVVETPDGLEIRRGELSDRAGAFTLSLPPSALSTGYEIRLRAQGRFGTDERTTHVRTIVVAARRAAPPTARPLPSLGTLALDRAIVHGGESIVVGYRASADPGMVRLIDALGTVRAEALLTPRGQSILVAPLVAADQDFRIVATVERGSHHDEASAPVTVLHAPAPAASGASAAPGAPGEMTPEAAAAAIAVPHGAAAIAVDREQRSGRDIVVRIDHYRKHLHVALMGPSTEEIVGVDVEPGERVVLLTPTEALAPARYAVVATYATGFGQETLLRPIVFRAP